MYELKIKLEQLGFQNVKIYKGLKCVKFNQKSINHSDLRAIDCALNDLVAKSESIKNFEIRRSGVGVTCLFQF